MRQSLTCRNNSESPEPNCISLVIGTKNIYSQAELCTFDVCWGGDGDGPLLADTIDLIENSIPWGQSAQDIIETGLPKLIENLNYCLTAWEKKYINNA